jgi:hypothetical protein
MIEDPALGARTETVVGSIEDLEVEVGSFGGEGWRIVEMLRVAKHLLERIKSDMGARASMLREGCQQLLGLFNRHLSALGHLARAHRLRQPHLLSIVPKIFFSRIHFSGFLLFLRRRDTSAIRSVVHSAYRHL